MLPLVRRARVAGIVLTAGLVVGASDAAQDLAQSVQKHYDTVRDFSADFVHTYQGGMLNKVITERGHVLIKKPGKMRWDYAAPDEKLFVSDGVKLYSYLPQDKQVIVGNVPPEDQASTPTLFLAGKGDLLRDFVPSLLDAVPPGFPAGTRALKLVPKSAAPDYDWLVLEIDPASLAIRGLVTVDAQGGQSTFFFRNLKENAGLADKDFAFRIPHGVDVVTSTSRP